MSAPEFEIIKRYFSNINYNSRIREHLTVPLGDDAAIINNALFSEDLVVCADTLCEGTHFLQSMDPKGIGFKALAVNVSDVVSMGAQPLACILCISIPTQDATWLEAFAAGLAEAAKVYGVSLIGGDTTKGHLSVSVQMLGLLNQAPLRRSDAQPRDLILVTGCLGDAAAGLSSLLSKDQDLSPQLITRFYRPDIHVDFVTSQQGVRACIDLSDGLIADLEHVCRASNLSAILYPNTLPFSPALDAFARSREQDPVELAIIGGEDYELCFTLDPAKLETFRSYARAKGVAVTVVGVMREKIEGTPILVEGKSETWLRELRQRGFQHFTSKRSQ